MATITITDAALPSQVTATQTTEPLLNDVGDSVGRIAVTLVYLPNPERWSHAQVETLLDDEMASMEALP